MLASPQNFAGRVELPCAPEAIDDFISEPTPRAIEVVGRTPGPFLVLGAGGKIGLHLCVMLRRALTQLGRKDRVIAVSRFRTLRDRSAFEQRGVETLPCDLGDQAQVDALPDAPTVFFMAGVKFGTSSAPNLLHAVNVAIPARIGTRFRTSRIIAFSSGCVYPFVTPRSGGATEETPMEAVGEYAASCIAREEAFMAAAQQHRNPIALVRLNYSIEFRYGVLVDIAQTILADRPIDLTTGYFNVIWQGDAVAHTIQCLDLAASPAAPVNVTGPELLSLRDIAQRFGVALQREVRFTGTEANTAWLNNASLSHRRFGLPLVSVDQMIGWISAWLLQNGETWGKPTGFDNRDGRF